VVKSARPASGPDREPSKPAPYYERIYAVVRRIPRGRVATYGQVAALAGFPRAPRLAGYALYALSPGSPLPWQRVVGAGGRLSLARLDPDAALTQRMRLEREGVQFDARGRVVLDRCGWTPGRRAPARTPGRAGQRAPGRGVRR
jgi:methylated-DNA-protein-cysteine methyltransferase-like protein